MANHLSAISLVESACTTIFIVSRKIGGKERPKPRFPRKRRKAENWLTNISMKYGSFTIYFKPPMKGVTSPNPERVSRQE